MRGRCIIGTELILLTALSAVSAVGAVVGGVQQSKAANQQAKAAQQEAELRARAEARSNIELGKRQKLAFLKSGVALEGSPLLLLSETQELGGENVGALLETGRTRAKSLRASGRQALIGGLTSAAGTVAGGFAGSGDGGTTTGGGGRITSGGVPIPGRKPLR